MKVKFKREAQGSLGHIIPCHTKGKLTFITPKGSSSPTQVRIDTKKKSYYALYSHYVEWLEDGTIKVPNTDQTPSKKRIVVKGITEFEVTE